MTMTDLGPAWPPVRTHQGSTRQRSRAADTVHRVPRFGGLVHHIAGVTVAFGRAAAKSRGESSDMAPWGDASKLDPDWRTSLPRRVRALAEAWRDPEDMEGDDTCRRGRPAR